MSLEFSLKIVTGGSLSDAPIRVLPLRRITIGREVGDYTFPSDYQMSTTHFAIHSDGRICTLTDVGSTNGTYVNEERIQEATVRNRDLIRAGQTSWEVIEIQIDERPKAFREELASPDYRGNSDAIKAPVLVLRVSGHSDRNIWPFQQLSVGRTDLSQWSFENDSSMSGLHFDVRFTEGAWILEDAGSTNGTMVNGGRVARTVLHDGDLIQAGQTRFDVAITSQPSDEEVHPREPSMAHSDIRLPNSNERNTANSGENRESDVRESSSATQESIDNTPIDPTSASSSIDDRSSSTNLNRPATMYLNIETPNGSRTFSTLLSGQRLVVGRNSQVGVVISTDRYISSRHAVIAFEQGVGEVSDLHSKNGTYLNERRVVSSKIDSGDMVRIGNTRIAVLIDHGSQKALVRSSTPENRGSASEPVLQIKITSEFQGASSKETTEQVKIITEFQIEIAQSEPDCAARLLLADRFGYMVDMAMVHGCLNGGDENQLTDTDSWITPAKAEEVSWMVALLEHWGNGIQWMVFGSGQPSEIRDALIRLFGSADAAKPISLWSDDLIAAYRSGVNQPSTIHDSIHAILRDDSQRRIVVVGFPVVLEKLQQ